MSVLRSVVGSQQQHEGVSMSSSVPATFPGRISTHIEPLEPRQLLSTVEFHPSSLYIYGDATDDRAVIQYKPDHSGALQVILNGVTYDQPGNSSINWIDVQLGEGNDQVSFKLAQPSLRTYI